MKIKLMDNYKEFDKEVSLREIAESISKSLEKRCIVGMVDGKLRDMDYVVKEDADVRFITSSDSEAIEVLNHSTAHLMAEAIKDLSM